MAVVDVERHYRYQNVNLNYLNIHCATPSKQPQSGTERFFHGIPVRSNVNGSKLPGIHCDGCVTMATNCPEWLLNSRAGDGPGIRSPWPRPAEVSVRSDTGKGGG